MIGKRIKYGKITKKGQIDEGTEEFLKSQLKQLSDNEKKWKYELINEEDQQIKWKKVEDKL